MKKRTWFFLNAVVEIEPGRFHRAGFGHLLLPHPPVVNWLLRRGLSKQAYKVLCTEHEMGHLQALPVEIIYSAALISLLIHNNNNDMVGWLLIIASSFSAWEICAELHTMWHVKPGYKELYCHTSLIPRIIFWSITLILMISGWVYALN